LNQYFAAFWSCDSQGGGVGKQQIVADGKKAGINLFSGKSICNFQRWRSDGKTIQLLHWKTGVQDFASQVGGLGG
jgi:hypothetical protein